MQEGGQVPPAPDTDSDFTGPLPETGLSVSNLFSQLESIESASPGPELDFSTVDLEGYDFSNIEEPEWYSTIPSNEDEFNAWIDQRVVVRPEPMVRTVSPSVTEEDVNADISAYNAWAEETNGQFAAADAEYKGLLEKAKAFESEREERVANQNRDLRRLNREANIDGLQSFVETGDATLLNSSGLRDVRMGFNIPGVGYSDRAIMTFSDLFGGEMPSVDTINEMLDERVGQQSDEEFNQIVQDHVNKELERRRSRSAGFMSGEPVSFSEEEVSKIRSEFLENYGDVLRENEYRKMLGELVIELLPEGQSLKLMETQVYEDLLNDADASDMAKALGFGKLSTLINIDDDKMFIGESTPEIEDQIHALVGIGIPRAELGLAGVTRFLRDQATYLTQGLTPGAPDSYTANTRAALDVSRRKYMDVLRDVDVRVEKAKRSQNVYAYTREQVRTLGALSGYTREEVASMGLDARVDAINAVNDASTAMAGLVDAEEFRKGLESLPNSLMGTALAFSTPYIGLGLSTAYISTGVYYEEYERSFDNPLLQNLTDDERAGYAMWKSGGEASGELMGNALFLGIGRYIAGGAKLTSGYVLGDQLLTRFSRMLGGYFMAMGLAYPEEYIAESVTEYIQLAADDYAQQLSMGKVQNLTEWHQKFDYYGFLQENEERIKEAGRIGGAMSFIPAAGATTISYGRAGLGRATNSTDFYERAIAQIVSGQTYTQELSRQERKELEQLTKDINNMSTSERMSEAGQAASERLVELTEKASNIGAKAAENLRGLARTNPQMLANTYQQDMLARDLEARGGTYRQTSNGRWTLNGKFIGDPTNTEAYAQNQKLSEEEKAVLTAQAKKLREGIKFNMVFGRYSSGMQTTDPTLVATRVQQDAVAKNWRESSDFQEITSQTDLTGMFESKEEQQMYESFQRMLREGESIIVHTGDLQTVNGESGQKGLYVEYSDGRRELHVNRNSVDQATQESDAGYVLAHEFGHRNTENILQDPEKRNSLADEVIKNNFDLALGVLESYTGVKPTAGVEFDLSVELSKLSPETLAIVQREMIVNYLDLAARGVTTGPSTSAISGILTDLGVKSGLVSNESLAAIAAQYMQTVRAAGLPTGVRTRAQREAVENVKAEESKADQMTAEEFEQAVEDGGKNLASRNVNLFRGGTVYFGFNNNIKAIPSGLEPRYRPQQRQFNDYFHLINWWRQQTGNGARPTVSQMYFVVDGVHVPIRPTDKWIKRDKSGKAVYMPGAKTFEQRKIDQRRRAAEVNSEFRHQKSALHAEVAQIWRDNFQFEGFAVDQNAFRDPNIDAFSMAGLVAQKRNMIGLLDQGITEEQFREMLGERQYLIDRRSNPELFDLGANVKYETFGQAVARVDAEAQELGLQPWQLLPESSVHYENKTETLGVVSQQELLSAMQKLDEYRENGSGEFSASTLASKEIRMGPYIEVSSYEFLEEQYGDLIESGRLVIVERTKDDVQLKEDAANRKTRTHRWSKYDRKKAGPVTYPVYDKNGKKIAEFNTYQSGGVFGMLELARITNGEVLMGPSHNSKASSRVFRNLAQEVVSMLRGGRRGEVSEFLYQDIALRAKENSLRSTHTMIDLLKYTAEFVRYNTDRYEEVRSMLTFLLNGGVSFKGSSEMIESEGAGAEARSEGQYLSRAYTQKTSIGYDFISTLKNIDGVIADQYGIRIDSLEGLYGVLESLTAPENFDLIDDVGFDKRADFVKKFSNNLSKATGGQFLNASQILEIIDEPAFRGLDENTIIATVEMIPDNVQSLNMDKEKPNSEEEAAFYENASFRHGSTGVNRIIIPKKSVSLGAKYKTIEPKGQGSTSAPIQLDSQGALASRRLPGRIYTQGNSAWEKSAATPYGQQLAVLALKYQDVFSDVLLLQQDVEVFKGSKVVESQDFEMAMDRYYGMVRNDLEMLEGLVQNIQKKMRDAGITSQDLSDYLYAKHAEERNKDIFSKNGKQDGSGMSKADADAIIDRLETSDMMDIAKDVYAIVENTRQTMIDGGLESRAVVEAWRKRYKNYVPLNGLAVDEMSDVSNSYPTGGAGMAIYGPSTRKATGRKTKTEHNLLGNIVMQNAAAHQRARKDQAMLSLYNLVKNNPNEKVWRVIGPKNPMIVNGKPVAANVLKNSDNTVPIRINGEQHFIYFKDPSYARSLNGMTTEKLTKIQQEMNKYVGFLRNSYTVWNPAFFIGNFARDFEMGMINAVAEIERDGGILEGYGMNTKDFSKKLSKTVFSTLGSLLKESAFGMKLDAETRQYFDEWAAAGGRTGWSYSDSLNKVVADLNNLATRSKTGQAMDAVGDGLRKFYANPKQFFEYVEGLNEAFENAVRLGAYIEARRAGLTPGRSAQLSKNITVNFNKSGEYTAGINSWFLFFNASVQGTSRFMRTMRKNEMYIEGNQGGTTDSWHNRISTSSKIAGGMVLFSAMQTLFNQAMSDEDEDGVLYYDKIPDYRKERNWIIMAGPRDPIYIPLPYGLNIFHNLGSTLAEVGTGHRDPLDGAAFLALAGHGSFSPVAFGHYDDIGQNVTMAMLPSVLKPMVETFVFNKTYFGGQVYREQSGFGAPVPEYQLAYRSPEYLIKLAEYLNQRSGGTTEVPGDTDINPDKYYYLAQSLTGGAGKFIGDVTDLAEAGGAVLKKNLNRAMESEDFIESLLTVEEDEKVQLRRSDVPIIKLMYGEASRFYDYDLYRKNSDEIEQAIREMKKGESLDFDFTGVMELKVLLDQTQKTLDAIKEYKKLVYEVDDYVDRNNELDKLSEGERMEYMLFNAAYEELRGKQLD